MLYSLISPKKLSLNGADISNGQVYYLYITSYQSTTNKEWCDLERLEIFDTFVARDLETGTDIRK